MEDVYALAAGCTRHYFLSVYLETLTRAGLRLDPPLWTGPPVPRGPNATHDALVRAWKPAALKARGFGG